MSRDCFKARVPCIFIPLAALLLLAISQIGYSASVALAQPVTRATPGQSLEITSVPNLRDIGGYKTSNGATVARGRVYRSDQLSKISPSDMAKLARPCTHKSSSAADVRFAPKATENARRCNMSRSASYGQSRPPEGLLRRRRGGPVCRSRRANVVAYTSRYAAMDGARNLASCGADQLIGTWKLVSAVMEDVDTKEQKLAWGTNPNGVIVLTPTGRWIALQTADGRLSPQTDEECAAAFRSMLAYSGYYRTEGQQIIIDVEIAWDESWIGTKQVRTFRIEGDTLHIEAAPQPYANFGGRIMRGILVWRREQRASK